MSLERIEMDARLADEAAFWKGLEARINDDLRKAYDAGKAHHAEEPWPQGSKELLAKVAGDATFGDYAAEVYLGLHDLLVSKQADYGPHAINRAPGGALNGINVRLHDKLERVIHLTGNGRYNGKYEGVLDTYRDLANYAVIAVMVLEGTWPQ